MSNLESASKKSRIDTYGPDALDEHLVLKVPLLLWTVVLYSALPLLVLALGALPKGGDFSFLRAYVGFWDAVAAMPAAAVLAAWFRRQPAGGPLPRALWRRGRWLLMLSLLLESWHAIAILSQPGLHVLPGLPWTELRLAGNGFCVIVLLTGKRIADTFQDFPEPA